MKTSRAIATILTAAILVLSHAVSYAQTTPFDGHNWKAPYRLPIPEGWTIERFLLPAPFAPQITFKGVEDIRFTPGWARKGDPEYWTYAFLWWLEGKQVISAKQVSAYLSNYYSGLYLANTQKSFPAKAVFNAVPAKEGDVATFEGNVQLKDYMTAQPVTLYGRIHLRYWSEDKTMVFHELSPQPYHHDNWTKLAALWTNFKAPGEFVASRWYPEKIISDDNTTPTVNIPAYTLINDTSHDYRAAARDIMHVKRKWPIAMQTLQAASFDSILAKHFFFQGNDAFFQRDEYIKNRSTPDDWVIVQADFDHLTLQFLQPDQAILSYTNRVKNRQTSTGTIEVEEMSWVDVFVQENGRWKIASTHTISYRIDPD